MTDTEQKKPLWPMVLVNLLLTAILITLVYFMFFSDKQSNTPVSHIPAFGMQSNMFDREFGIAQLEGKSAFVLNVFASWCTPCEAEHPVLTDLVETHNVPIYGIALKDDAEELNNFLDRLGNPYQDIGMDNAGLMLSGLGITGVPTTLVADKDMKIHFVYEGPLTQKIVSDKILPLIQKLNK